MTDTIKVVVNDKHYTVPDDFGCTPDEFAEECGYTVKDWGVFRVGHLDDGATVTEDDRCTEPMVVDDGDEFLIVPRYVTGGG